MRPIISASILVEHIVHLLQGSSHSLRNEEVHPDQRQEAERGEENVGSEPDGRNHRRCDESLLKEVNAVYPIVVGSQHIRLTMMKLLPQFDIVA
jgi:hypothetical protein